MKKAYFVILLFIIGALAKAQLPSIKTARDYLQQKGEVYFSFDRPGLKSLPEILKTISLDKTGPDLFFAYANADQFEQFLAWNIPFRVLEHPGDANVDLNMKTWPELKQKDLISSWDFYPTYEAYVDLMTSFENEYPALCRIYNIGTTVMGRSLLFAKISANVNQREKEPRIMLTSTIHGDEPAGFVLLLRFIHYLLSNYATNPEISFLLNNTEIWICPNENPDGTYTNNNATISGATRGNANHIDLNRNYPNPVYTPALPYQPETIAMMKLADTARFVLSANIHGGIECINYPFDSWTSDVRRHADHDWWYFVAREYADTARKYSPENYMNPEGPSFSNGVTHGGDWYVVHGGRQDYMNYYARTRELTLELSNAKMLPAAQLPALWEYNYRSLINFIRQSLYGIRGTITNAHTGEPVAAKIEILNHDKYNSEVWSEKVSGGFFRPVLQGAYDLKISAGNYVESHIPGVIVENYGWVNLTVSLYEKPAATLANVEKNDMPLFQVFPNPVSQHSFLKIELNEPASLKISLFNINGLKILTKFEGLLDKGTFNLPLAEFTSQIKAGVYLLQIVHPQKITTFKLVIR